MVPPPPPMHNGITNIQISTTNKYLPQWNLNASCNECNHLHNMLTQHTWKQKTLFSNISWGPGNGTNNQSMHMSMQSPLGIIYAYIYIYIQMLARNRTAVIKIRQLRTVYAQDLTNMHVIESTSHDMIATLLEKVHVDSSDPTLMLSILNMWLLYTCTLCTFVATDHNPIRWSFPFWV